ncbi:hypothetical protein BH23CHL2_BH23CHL2_06830 [soil metagenome]
MNRLVYGVIAALMVLATGMAASQPEARATAAAVEPDGTTTTVDDGSGNETDPHISGSLVTYTSENDFYLEIRYRDLMSGAGGVIPGEGRDRLADISGDTIVFTRTLDDRLAVFAFDVSLGSTSQLDPQVGSLRLDPAIGNTTVAWGDRGPVSEMFPSSEIVVYDLVTENATRLTDDAATDTLADVSPDGSVVVWEKCQPAPADDCAVWQATRTGSDWTTLQLTGNGIDGRDPATDGQFVVYQSTRAGETDLFWQPAGGGSEQQLSLPGDQLRPSISDGLIAFETEVPATDRLDIIVYDLNTGNLYQITDTPDRLEALADIVVDPTGLARVVYSERDPNRDVYAFSFEPAGDDITPPVLHLPGDITVNAGTSDGAVVDYTAIATDESDGSLNVDCEPPSGSTFPIGTTVVSCAAIDSTGNHSEGTFTVTVLGASEQFTELSQFIETLELSGGTENALQTQLDVAQKHLENGQQQAACTLLAVFDHHVEIQASDQLTGEQVAQLLSASQRVQAVIGCS